MAQRKELSFAGPFLRLGNTFFDDAPLTFSSLPEGDLTPFQYSEVSRLLLRERHARRLQLFKVLPEYLGRHRNGVLWRDAMLLYSFSMPLRFVDQLFDLFHDDIFKCADQFIVYHIFKMLLESGVGYCVQRSIELLVRLESEHNFHEIACIYAMILEEGTDYDKSRSELIRAQFDNRGRFVATLRSAIQDLQNAAYLRKRLHGSKPIILQDVLLSLAKGVERPSYFERIYYEKVLLEAYTGFDLRDFYTDLQLRPVSAYDALERMSESVDLNLYAPGERYFFGSPIES